MRFAHTHVTVRPPARVLIAATAACVSLLLFAGCGKEKKVEAPAGPTAVTFVEVKPKNGPVTFEKIAQTQSSQLVNIQARVSGFLDKRLYTEGAVVNKGQTLFQIDQKPFQVQVDQANAALSKAETNMRAAKTNLDRTTPLVEANALSRKDLDDATSRYQSDVASVEQSKAQLESARLNLSYTTITSPVTGLAGAAQQADGTYISSQNSQLTTVTTLNPIWVNFSMSENEMLKYRNEVAKGLLSAPKGDSYLVEVVLSDGSIFPYKGRITFAAPTYNSQTGTFQLRASVDNPQGALRPNQFVRVRLKGAVRPQAILLPQRAVQQGPKGHFVWVVGQGDAIEQRPVTVGEWEGEEWFVSEGVKAGERVVVDGTLALSPGAKVSAQPLSAAGAR